MYESFSDLDTNTIFPSIRTFQYHELISSTNDGARQLLSLPRPSRLPCLVVAKHQTAGRGRGGKSWWGGEGALMMSLGYRLDSLALSRDSLSVLSLAAGLAVLRTVDACLSGLHTVQIHWPNDVYVDGAKIAGILLESPDPLSVVLGIGINVNNRLEEAPLEIREALSTYPITTMFDLLGRSTDRVGLIVDFLDRFQELIERISRNPEPVIREVERCCIQVGRELTVRHETRLIRGRCLGLGPDASLHLETAEGLRQIHTGIVQSGG